MTARLFLLLLTWISVAGSAVFAAEPLKVGMELAYPPFEMTDTSGTPIGLSVDLANALGKALERPVVIENIAYGGLIPALRTGKVDCVISSMTVTRERSRAVDFSKPYLKTGLALLVGKGSKIRSIKDLNKRGRKVAVKIDTTGHLYAARHLQKADVIVLDKETRCVLEVAQKKADAFLYDQMSVYKNWRENTASTEAVLAPFQQEAWAVAVRKGNRELLDAINAFLLDYRKQGGFDQLGNQWLAEQKAEFARQNIPFVF